MSLNKNISGCFMAVLALCFAGSCTDKDMNIKGQLIYRDGGGSIEAIDLESPEFSKSLVYKNKTHTHINHVDKTSDATFLFSECDLGTCTIKQYSIDLGDIRELRVGLWPSYIRGHEKMFFYERGADDTKWLFMASMKDINEVSKIARKPEDEGFTSLTMPVIQVSPDEVIFIGEDSQLWSYNIKNSETTKTGAENCRPYLLRTKSNQILCKGQNTWAPYLLDMDKKEKIELPEREGAYSFVYLEQIDAFIFGRTRGVVVAEIPELFLYSFTDKKETRIKKYAHMASGFWIPNGAVPSN